MRLFLFISIFFILKATSAKTIVVGPNQVVHSLKKAIEQAKDKDTILLQAGIYKEGSIILTKSLTIIGQNNPVLDGENKYETLLISGKNILIRGIWFRNSGYSAMDDYASIKLVDCSNVVIENNRVTGSYFAIHISNSLNAVVRGNTIIGNPSTEQMTGNGIHLWKSSHAIIENNNVQGHRDGIYFEFVTFSSIKNNLSEKNIRYGLHFMFSNQAVFAILDIYSKKIIIKYIINNFHII